jgi:hypothetical protein
VLSNICVCIEVVEYNTFRFWRENFLSMAPKKNKRQPKNAFYFFMLDFKESRGQAVANLSTQDLAELAGQVWSVSIIINCVHIMYILP